MPDDPISDPTVNSERAGRDSRPATVRATASLEPSDEISLRELYLTLRRGLWGIVVAALLAGAATFAYVSLRPPIYRAAAIAQITPLSTLTDPEAQIGADTAVGFETYRAVASSRTVIETVRAALSDAGFGSGVASAFDAAAFGTATTLQRLSAAGDSSLTVEHSVAAADPERAALIANAWTNATLESLRNDLLAGLEATGSATRGELARLTATRDAARSAWSTFRERDDRTLLQGRLQAIGAERNNALARIGQLDTELRASQARQALLSTQLGSAPEGDPETQLRTLQENDLIDEQTAAQLLLLLDQRSEASDNDLLELIRRTALQRELVASAGMGAERDALRERIEALTVEAEELRIDIARLQGESDVLEQDLMRAESEYAQLASVPSRVALVRELLPTVGRIVNDASAPLQPESDRRTLLTLVATLAVGAAAVLFVLLREAVRDPEEPRST